MKVFFNKIKEVREWYSVEYFPPQEGIPIAELNLIVFDWTASKQIAEAMEPTQITSLAGTAERFFRPHRTHVTRMCQAQL